MKPIQMFQSTDGKLFPSERDCARYEVDGKFLKDLESLTSKVFTAELRPALRNEQLANAEVMKWVVRHQEKLLNLLMDYARAIDAFNTNYPAKEETR